MASALPRGRRGGGLPSARLVRLGLAAAAAAGAPRAALAAGDAEPELSAKAQARLKEALAQDHGLDNLEVTGCYHYGYRYHPAMEVPGHEQPFHMRTPMHCQAWCRATKGCANFAFWLDNHECWLGGKDAVLVMAKSFGALAGPATCPTADPPESCTEIPSFLFPAPSRNQTQMAWDSGMQPTNLQCWPRKASGFPANCSGQEVQILEDTDKGWPGQCEGLKLTDLPAGDCQIRCMHNPLCAVWQTKGSPASCYHGMFGTNCYQTTGEKPLRAQRLMHGDFRVLMNAAGIQIMGLQKAFDVTVFPVLQDAEAHCRMVCVSYLLCQYWQYSDVYGCWIEDVRVKRIAYPLVNNGVDLRTNSGGAKTVTAGEFIQHTCKQGPPVPLPLDEPTMTITTTTSTKATPGSTVLTRAADAGDTELAVQSEVGFDVGDHIEIAGGGKKETAVITSFGTIVVAKGLNNAFPVGTTVAVQEQPGKPATATRSVGFRGTRTTAPVLTGGTEAQVESSEGLSAGDRIRISYGQQTEGATVSDVGDRVIYFTGGLQHGYPSPAIVTEDQGHCYDTNGAAKDKLGTGCGFYTENPGSCPSGHGGDDATANDDADFTASDMCCECGGGSSQAPTVDEGPAPSPPPPPPPAAVNDKGSGGVSLGAPQVAPEMAMLGLLVLLGLLCAGCIGYAFYVALERRKYNSSRAVSLVKADAGDGPSPPSSPQAQSMPTWGLPTQVMPQQGYPPQQGYYGGYDGSPTRPALQPAAAASYGGQGCFPQPRGGAGGPLGGPNQYYSPQSMPNYYG